MKQKFSDCMKIISWKNSFIGIASYLVLHCSIFYFLKRELQVHNMIQTFTGSKICWNVFPKPIQGYNFIVIQKSTINV